MFDDIIKGNASPVLPNIQKTTFKAGQRHAHQIENDKYSIQFISEGNGIITVENEAVRFGSGDTFWFPPTSKYEYTFDAQSSPIIYSAEYKLFSEQSKINSNRFLHLKSGKRHSAQTIKTYFERMLEKDDSANAAKDLLLISELYKLLYELYSLVHDDENEKNELRNGIKYIESNYLEEFDIEYVAKLCGLCLSLFYKNFKKATGLTPIEYKNRLKIDRAIELLKEKKYSMEEISTMLNFCNQSYFIRTFKRFTGYTPKQFMSKE